MGAAGFGILDDDFARDVYGDYLVHFNAGLSPSAIVDALTKEHHESLRDEDDQPLFQLALAKAQWDCGQLNSDTLAQVHEIITAGKTLARWRESGPKGEAKRQAKLIAFLEKIQTPNLRPRKPRPPTHRKPVFEPGDCVAVKLSDGSYGALLVLASPETGSDPKDETYGINVIGLLKYKSLEKPTRAVFEAREWLTSFTMFIHGEFHVATFTEVMRYGFRAVRDSFEVVGQLPIHERDMENANSFSPWGVVLEDLRMQEKRGRG